MSFGGLHNLSLLLEDRFPSQYPSMLVAVFENHEPTLRSFIWDIRKKDGLSTKEEAQFKNHVASISEFRPLLEELGLSFDWHVLLGVPAVLNTLEYVRKET